MTLSSDAATNDTLQQVLARGAAAMSAGDKASAEAAFREACRIAPNDAIALHSLGHFLFTEKRTDDAEQVLIQAAAFGALPQSLLILSAIFEERKRYKEAILCLERLLKSDLPKHQIHSKVAALKGLLGDAQGERESYRLAVLAEPSDTFSLFKLADITLKAAREIFATDLAAALRLTEDLYQLSNGNPSVHIQVLPALAEYTEWQTRRLNGQAPYHAAHMDELFFRHGHKYIEELEEVATTVCERKPNSEDSRISLAIAKFCLGKRHAAEALVRASPQRMANHVFGTVSFAPEFYDELRNYSADDLTRDLPPLLSEVAMPGNPDGIVYLSCNFSYLHAFALPMVVSLREKSPGCAVHLHVMDATPQQVAFIVAFMEKLAPLRFALSVERPGLSEAPVMEARSYYHAVRFIRFYRHLMEYQCPLWIMDVDAIVNRELSSLMSRLPGSDVAVRVRPGRLEPWNQFNACMVGANSTEASVEYFRLIAAYIAHFHQRRGLRWGIDQLAMYGVYADMHDRDVSPSLSLLDPRDVDYEYQETGYIWTNSGVAKLQHMKRINTPGAPPLRAPTTTFDVSFERYWQECVRVASAIGVAL